MTYLKVLSLYLPGEAEEKHKSSVRIASSMTEMQMQYLPNTTLECSCYINQTNKIVRAWL